MNCLFCNEHIKDKGPSKHKVRGRWAHKACPGRKPYRKMGREKNKKEEPK